MKIKVGQLRQIIREVAEETADGTAAAAEELEATAGDWVADNYDAILAKLQSDPKLADAILAAAGVNESYAGDLANDLPQLSNLDLHVNSPEYSCGKYASRAKKENGKRYQRYRFPLRGVLDGVSVGAHDGRGLLGHVARGELRV